MLVGEVHLCQLASNRSVLVWAATTEHLRLEDYKQQKFISHSCGDQETEITVEFW
jgi:hypothetical protein